MAAAIAAARAGGSVTIYERNERVGKKLLSTGNGKCNLGNEDLSAAAYHGGDPKRIASVLRRFGTKETKAFFQSLGLWIKDRDGYLYPGCEQAAVVLDVLRLALDDLGIRLVAGTKVETVRRLKDGRLEVCWDQGKEAYDRVILACGGKAAPKTGSDGSGYRLARQLGLQVKEAVPALVGLCCSEEACKALAGVRADAEVRILEGEKVLARERGEVQMVEYGISGIPVFQLSGSVNGWLRGGRKLVAWLDFLPDVSREELDDLFYGRLSAFRESGRTVEAFFTGMLHKKLMMVFLKSAGLGPNLPVWEADVSRLRRVFEQCKAFPLHVTGSKSFDQAQVCAGGVVLSEVGENFEALRVPGLYLTGELLDVDGRCGGYNLHWAWASGNLAGRDSAR